MSKLPDDAGLTAIGVFVAVAVLGALGLLVFLGFRLVSVEVVSVEIVIGLVVGIVLGTLIRDARDWLQRVVRTLSKDVRADSEEAKLESDILRARLAELERRLDERDAGNEES
jgi:hypothetical protein